MSAISPKRILETAKTEIKDEVLFIRCDLETHTRVRQLAKKHKVSQNQVTIAALHYFMDRYEVAENRAKRKA